MTVDSNIMHDSFHDGLTLPPSASSPTCPPLRRPPPPRIDGTCNVRDFGGHGIIASSCKPSSSSSTTTTSMTTRPGIILRSAHLEHVTDEGIQQLQSLHVSRVFDLRGTEESRQYRSIVPNNKASPVAAAALLPPCSAVPFETTTDEVALRLEKYTTAMEGIVPEARKMQTMAAQYLDLVTSKSGIHAVQTILRHLLTHPGQTILIHCTLGKDRTGIVFALLLSLAGVSDEVIAADYALSEQGLELVRAKMVSAIGKLYPDLTPQTVTHKVDAIIRCHPQVMLSFLQLLRERCGGAAGYVRDLCRLSESEMTVIKKVLTVRTLRG
ncbi:hypothetical protein E4U43_000907 [Claviceps pusilla]|uniref:Tyrosine specific protein phosphatases domain-containing protein n=1 Tax=Claviceps pusilla TaxID=123648 RepID=A0A9P7N8L8_9HYPO|nr:hypothetical protein E4U43_000907 [Claviceps pusilla]